MRKYSTIGSLNELNQEQHRLRVAAQNGEKVLARDVKNIRRSYERKLDPIRRVTNVVRSAVSGIGSGALWLPIVRTVIKRLWRKK